MHYTSISENKRVLYVNHFIFVRHLVPNIIRGHPAIYSGKTLLWDTFKLARKKFPNRIQGHTMTGFSNMDLKCSKRPETCLNFTENWKLLKINLKLYSQTSSQVSNKKKLSAKNFRVASGNRLLEKITLHYILHLILHKNVERISNIKS